MKKTALAIITFAFSFLIVARVQTVDVAYANFFPTKQIISPENTIYKVANVPLDVRVEILDYYNTTVDKIFDCLDGHANVTIPITHRTINATQVSYVDYRGYDVLSSLTNGAHAITVYYESKYGSFVVDSVNFTVEAVNITPTPTATPEPTPIADPFPTTLLIASAVAVVAVVGLGLLVYLKKHKREAATT